MKLQRGEAKWTTSIKICYHDCNKVRVGVEASTKRQPQRRLNITNTHDGGNRVEIDYMLGSPNWYPSQRKNQHPRAKNQEGSFPFPRFVQRHRRDLELMQRVAIKQMFGGCDVKKLSNNTMHVFSKERRGVFAAAVELIDCGDEKEKQRQANIQIKAFPIVN